MFRKTIKYLAWIFLAATVVVALRPPLRNYWHNEHAAIPLFVSEQGVGTPVVLLHGLTGTHEYFALLTSRLSQTNRVIAPDLLGFGRSPWPDISYAVDEHLAALEPVLPKEPFVLVGHSMGALLALEFARRNPERAVGLVLISPPSILDRVALGKILKAESAIESLMELDNFWAPLVCHLHEAFGELTYYAYRPFVERALPDAVVLAATQHRWASYNGSLENVVLKLRGTEMLPQMKVPTLIVVGDHDAYIDQAKLQLIAPKAVIAKGGHNILWEQPEVVIGAVEKFVATSF
jgi:cis-3-alkyl-4-acyloxetan-2-one decarboxylase